MRFTVRPRLALHLPCWILLGAQMPSIAAAATLQVGADKPYKAVKDAVAAAKPGDVVEVDAGEYVDDISSITVNDLTIRGVGGARAHLKATVPPPNKKGIFVVEGGVGPVTLEHLEFSGARISEGDGNNGAGIRAQGTDLRVRDCYIHDNQNGILAGEGLMTVEHSEFAYNGEAGYEHNIYVGAAPKFVFRGNYSHHAKSGHAVKSRALENHIVYNRLMEEADGNGSALIDLPQGGLSYVIGNLIQKGPAAENKYRVVLYKGEGGTNPDLRLYVSHNTFVNDGAPGVMFVDVKAATEVTLANNLFVGEGTPIVLADMNIPVTDVGNLQTAAAGLVDRAGYDYHLLPDSPAIDVGVALAPELTPDSMYLPPLQTEPRPVVDAPDVGAYEFGQGAGETTGGEDTGEADSTTTTDAQTDTGGGPTGGETAGTTVEPGGDSTGGDSTDDPGTVDTGGATLPTTEGPTTGVGSASATTGTGDDAAAGSDDSGCGCNSDARRSGWAVLGLLVLVPRRRRA